LESRRGAGADNAAGKGADLPESVGRSAVEIIGATQIQNVAMIGNRQFDAALFAVVRQHHTPRIGASLSIITLPNSVLSICRSDTPFLPISVKSAAA
ncbi:MAG: hypothetical protein Q4P24_15895, partial [Rhodobacterales bacterium]|nr:hypothetical protein [Rhodobacterales bacterium]